MSDGFFGYSLVPPSNISTKFYESFVDILNLMLSIRSGQAAGNGLKIFEVCEVGEPLALSHCFTLVCFLDLSFQESELLL